MKHLFLDTNILLDFLVDRKPFSDQAALLFQHAQNKAVTLYVAAISFNNIYYIIRQVHNHKKTIELITLLESLVETISVDKAIIQKALNAEFKDFEDAIQNFAADSQPEIDAIITRNQKDFKHSTLPVFSPEMALTLIVS